MPDSRHDAAGGRARHRGCRRAGSAARPRCSSWPRQRSHPDPAGRCRRRRQPRIASEKHTLNFLAPSCSAARSASRNVALGATVAGCEPPAPRTPGPQGPRTRRKGGQSKECRSPSMKSARREPSFREGPSSIGVDRREPLGISSHSPRRLARLRHDRTRRSRAQQATATHADPDR